MTRAPLRRLAGVLSLGALALGALPLAGCITLLPKATPSQLYRFGGAPLPAAGPASIPVGTRPGLLLEGVTFPRASTSDGILTVTGDEAAYISGARWVSPAVLLFTEAVQRAYDARAQGLRLSVRGALGRTQGSVRVAVRDFQAEYRQGQAAAPTIVVTLHARLTRSDGQVVDERDFQAVQPAADNRVAAIVPAFDAATGQALAALVSWTDALAPRLADAPSVLIPGRTPGGART